MSVRNPDGYRANLAASFRAADIELPLRRADAISLNVVGVGNHTYLTVRDRIKSEVVRYDHVQNWDATDPTLVRIPVTRDVSGLGLRSFAFGTCVEAELTSFFIRDLVAESIPPAPICPEPLLDCSPVNPVATSEDSDLPTTVYGSRLALLGAPDGFFELCPGTKVPFYSDN